MNPDSSDSNYPKTAYYANKDFWNSRFEKTNGYYDWYIGWAQLKPHLINYLSPDSSILMVGCGNSKMSEDMYQDNFTNIINIDISEVVINKMKLLYQDKYEKMSFCEMDATSMTFPENSFDFIIDKGTLDALLCSENQEIPVKILQEMFRVTKNQSYFCVITYGEPKDRVPLFLDALPKYQYELSCKRIGLSFMANFINSLRTHSSDSIAKSLKDEKVIENSVMDAFISSVMNMDESGLSEADRKKRKKIELFMKMCKLLKNKSKSEVDDKGNNELSLSNTSETTSTVKKEEDSSSCPRRTHCYLYLFKKMN